MSQENTNVANRTIVEYFNHLATKDYWLNQWNNMKNDLTVSMLSFACTLWTIGAMCIITSLILGFAALAVLGSAITAGVFIPCLIAGIGGVLFALAAAAIGIPSYNAFKKQLKNQSFQLAADEIEQETAPEIGPYYNSPIHHNFPSEDVNYPFSNGPQMS